MCVFLTKKNVDVHSRLDKKLREYLLKGDERCKQCQCRGKGLSCVLSGVGREVV